METKVTNKLDYINALPAISFMDDQVVKTGFLSLYKATHPGESDEQALIFYERESHFLKRIIVANPKLAGCSTFSLYCCFIDIITIGATFEPAAGLLYIETRGYNIAAYGKPAQWEQRANNKFTADGELNLRMQLNQLKYMDTPVVVHEGDVLRIGQGADKKKYIIWEASIPRKANAKVIAVFTNITRTDSSVDVVFLTEEDFTRFQSASAKQNTRNNQQGSANELYASFNGGIDPGFAATKLKRHAFRAFPKAKILGSNTVLEDEPGSETNMVFERGNVTDQPPGQQQQPVQPPAPGAAAVTTWSSDQQQPSLTPQPLQTTPVEAIGVQTKAGEGVQFSDINF